MTLIGVHDHEMHMHGRMHPWPNESIIIKVLHVTSLLAHDPLSSLILVYPMITDTGTPLIAI